MGIPKVLFASLCCLGAGMAAPVHPALRWDAGWQGLSPRQTVIINGSMAKGPIRAWSTYQNGVFNRENYSEDCFRVPVGVSLVVVQADLTFEAAAKLINIEFILKQDVSVFPLARATFFPPDGSPTVTMTKNFMPGLVIPAGGRLSIVDPDRPNSSYGITIYGFYFR